jgi:hypothetical protein
MKPSLSTNEGENPPATGSSSRHAKPFPHFLQGAFEGVDSPLAILWKVLPAQEVASRNVADRILRNPHDTSRGVCPRVVAVQPDIACRATLPVACVHKLSSRLVIFEPLHDQLPTNKSIDGELFLFLI